MLFVRYKFRHIEHNNTTLYTLVRVWHLSKTQQDGAVSNLHGTNCSGAPSVVWNPHFLLIHLVTDSSRVHLLLFPTLFVSFINDLAWMLDYDSFIKCNFPFSRALKGVITHECGHSKWRQNTYSFLDVYFKIQYEADAFHMNLFNKQFKTCLKK